MEKTKDRKGLDFKRLAIMLKRDLQRKKAYKQALRIKALKRNLNK